MSKTGYAIMLGALFLSFGCDASQDALEDSLPEFYILTTQVSPEDGGFIQPESGEYLAGDSLEVEAIAADGYVFEHWEGDMSGNTNPNMIQLNSNSTVTAHFSLKDYNLNIDIEGSGTVREVVIERSETVTVQLEAEAEEGWSFDRWENDLSGNSNPESITLENDEEKNVTAIFVEDAPDGYSLTLSTEGEGSVESDPDKDSYSDGEEVTLTAEASSGWSFKEWQADLSGSDNPVTITLDEDKEVTAIFEEDDDDAGEEYSLTISTDGEGSVDRDPDKDSYSDGEEITLTAEATSGWSFVEWQGDISGSDNPKSITLDEDKEVTAIFEQDDSEGYSITLDTEGEGSVDRDPDKNSYIDGEDVTLTAEAASGWSFKEWDGDLSGSDNPETITLDEDKEVTAIFEQDDSDGYSFSIETEGAGSVEKDPDKDSYANGEEVTLTAEASSGWSFKEWQGDISGSDNPETITFNEDKEVTAVFEEDPPEEYLISVTTDGEGSVNKNPDKNSYSDGEDVTLTAEAASGWSFKEWSGDLSGSTNPETITVDENKQITAVFEEDPPEEYSLSVNTDGDGSVDVNPDKDSYTEGEEVTLTASPASGWSLVEWQGDVSGSSNPVTITLDDDKNVTAIFEQDAVMEINIHEVKLFIVEMGLEGARRTDDFETENFILNLPLDGTAFNITHVTIPAGYYSELELEIEKPENSVGIGDSDFRDGSGSYSLVVHGIYNGADFKFQSTEDFEIEVDIAPHLEIQSGQTSVIALDVDFESWFRSDNGDILDPGDSGNAERINENIEDSFSDFEDNFKPGR